jgi:pyruvate kinase
MDKKTKVVCTIGPSSENKEMIAKLVNEGMNIARLNFSHGDYEEQGNRIKMLREVSKDLKKPIGILLDTKGPEVRLGVFENGGVQFEKGDEVTIVNDPDLIGTREKFAITVPEVFNDVKPGDFILMDDGKMRVDITAVEPGKQMTGIVANPHFLKSKKGCNLPGIILSMPFISEKDDSDIRYGARNDVDYIALSFVRRKEDVLAVRDILISEGKDNIQIIAKIENQEGFDNLPEILEVADGIMVARGDLGVNVSLEYVPIYQKQMIKMANAAGKPVITATHMLESMASNPRPTRAEASDVANAIMDGTDAVMTSAETAAGSYPAEAVHTFTKIAKAMEPIIDYDQRLREQTKSAKRSMSDSIAISAAEAALTMDIKAIIAFTQSGESAKRLAKFRPVAPIIAVTFDEAVQRSLLPVFGVHPVVTDVQNTQQNDVQLARNIALKNGLHHGDTIVVVAGYPVGTGSTNSIKIVTV